MNKIKLISSIAGGAFIIGLFFYLGLSSGDTVYESQLKAQRAEAAAQAAREEARLTSCSYIGTLTQLCYSGSGDSCNTLVEEEQTYSATYNIDAYNDCMVSQPEQPKESHAWPDDAAPTTSDSQFFGDEE